MFCLGKQEHCNTVLGAQVVYKIRIQPVCKESSPIKGDRSHNTSGKRVMSMQRSW